MKTEIDLIEGEHVGDVFRHANANAKNCCDQPEMAKQQWNE